MGCRVSHGFPIMEMLVSNWAPCFSHWWELYRLYSIKPDALKLHSLHVIHRAFSPSNQHLSEMSLSTSDSPSILSTGRKRTVSQHVIQNGYPLVVTKKAQKGNQYGILGVSYCITESCRNGSDMDNVRLRVADVCRHDVMTTARWTGGGVMIYSWQMSASVRVMIYSRKMSASIGVMPKVSPDVMVCDRNADSQDTCSG